MFEKLEPLGHSKHQELRISKIASYAFAGTVSTVKLTFSELRLAARFYPIVFLQDSPGVPQALLSLEQGKNAFVDKNGNWKVPYIPVHFRVYPFTLCKIQDKEDTLALCLDPDAEHFKSGMGDPLFTADGEPNEFVQQSILKSLEAYHKELETTKALFTSLDQEGLIVDRVFKYTVDQEERSINGFKGIDMEKLMACDDKRLAELVKNGGMSLVYEHVYSLNNFSSLLNSPVA